MSFRKDTYETYRKEKDMKVSGISEQKDFAILEPGSHAAVCTQIIGLGMQEREWQGVITEKPIVKLKFEVPAERVTWTDKEGVEGEGPMVIWSTYNATLHENSKLRAHLVSWRGKQFSEQEIISFELNNVLDKPCMISVIHTANEGRTYTNVDNVSRLMKGIEAPKAEGGLITFDPYDHTEEELAALPNWLQELINNGKELEAAQKDRVRAVADAEIANMQQTGRAEDKPAVVDDEFGDDLPF
jgi:hypothetical protein